MLTVSLETVVDKKGKLLIVRNISVTYSVVWFSTIFEKILTSLSNLKLLSANAFSLEESFGKELSRNHTRQSFNESRTDCGLTRVETFRY